MRSALALAFALCFAACQRLGPPGDVDAGPRLAATDPSATLSFRVNGREVRALSLADLERVAPPETVSSLDGYYHRVKRFRALPLGRVLAAGFAGAVEGPLARQHFILRARDGYTVPMTGERLLEGGAYIAVRDEDVPGWEPIGPQRANPAPAYLVWTRPEQSDLESHPRPWQLAAIEVARFEDVFPHTAPTGVADGDPARRGFALFAELCVRCHAVNREGGRVGPDLNVPRSIVEYRPVDQIRAYIRDPRSFRYGTMPAHPQLSDADLDALVSYFTAMRDRKHDPDADGGAP
ncbi:MAG: cytochrome c [Polyangiales bacterium]